MAPPSTRMCCSPAASRVESQKVDSNDPVGKIAIDQPDGTEGPAKKEREEGCEEGCSTCPMRGAQLRSRLPPRMLRATTLEHWFVVVKKTKKPH